MVPHQLDGPWRINRFKHLQRVRLSYAKSKRRSSGNAFYFAQPSRLCYPPHMGTLIRHISLLLFCGLFLALPILGGAQAPELTISNTTGSAALTWSGLTETEYTLIQSSDPSGTNIIGTATCTVDAATGNWPPGVPQPVNAELPDPNADRGYLRIQFDEDEVTSLDTARAAINRAMGYINACDTNAACYPTNFVATGSNGYQMSYSIISTNDVFEVEASGGTNTTQRTVRVEVGHPAWSRYQEYADQYRKSIWEPLTHPNPIYGMMHFNSYVWRQYPANILFFMIGLPAFKC